MTELRFYGESGYGCEGYFEWMEHVIALFRDIFAFEEVAYCVSIFSFSRLYLFVLTSPDGYHINFPTKEEAYKAGREHVECIAHAQGNAFPVSANNWKYNKTLKNYSAALDEYGLEAGIY